METKDVILELRTKKGLSQDELAEKVYVTRQAVSRWENGETIPNTETLKLLSGFFDVSINTLLGSPRQLICQCCGMPLDDSTISKEPDGTFNEEYCKWCYTDGKFTYDNIKRHKKILWNSTKKISYVCAFLVAAVLAGVYLLPEEKTVINEIVMTWLPYFVFIMYAINRGTNFTQALFMNCDHSLLTYSFYKQPSFILRLFQIRLREIMKINAVPALVIGIGLALILFATGGTDNPLNYVVLVVSILCMSLFFSIHYLTIYYLLQPYNAGTELKSGTYRIVLSVTYVVCFALMRLRMPIMIFGIMTIVFCVLYSIVASILVYRFAPKTFRLRT